jgi:hypothetical protein
MKKITAFFILTSSIFFYSCKTSQEYIYKFNLTEKGDSKDIIASKEKIDGTNAYETYFKLDKAVKCLKISISATAFADSFGKKQVVLKTYFTLEKALNIVNFKAGKDKYLFSELGRNFDQQWDRSRDITVCSSDEDPIKKLDSKSVYRIRFTPFTGENFSYQIKISSDEKALFLKNLE